MVFLLLLMGNRITDVLGKHLSELRCLEWLLLWGSEGLLYLYLHEAGLDCLLVVRVDLGDRGIATH